MSASVLCPELQGLRRQLSELEWLLEASRLDPKRWRARVTAQVVDGSVTLGVVLTKRTNAVVRVQAESRPVDADRHFWVNGNHWYEKHAVGVLADLLTAEVEDEGEGHGDGSS